MSTQSNHWIDGELDFSDSYWSDLLYSSAVLKTALKRNLRHDSLLRGKTIYSLFYNRSLRTRSSLAAAIGQLGGVACELDPQRVYLPALAGEDVAYSTERISDVARVLSRYGDAVAIRMYGSSTDWVLGKGNRVLKEFANWSSVPVINLECDRFHPCQSLATMLTLQEAFGTIKKKKLVVGWAYSPSCEKPISVPQSIVLAACKLGMDVVLAHPPGFELEPTTLSACGSFAASTGGTFAVSNELPTALQGADAVYLKSWGSSAYFSDPTTGRELDRKGMQQLFDQHIDWKMTEDLFEQYAPSARYMHCLPADRDYEVETKVIDGPRSLVFDEAENRLHVIKAVLMAMLRANTWRDDIAMIASTLRSELLS